MEQQLWFGPEFVEEHRRRFGTRPRSGRQLTYDIAVDEEYAPRRAWLSEQLDLLAAKQAAEFGRKLWLDESHWPCVFELAAGAALRGASFTAVYEGEHGRLTPDWTVLGADGKPAMFVEVHTDQPARQTFGQIRGWHYLDQLIRKIPVGVVLGMAARGNVPPRPPEAGTAKRIARDLRGRLLASPVPPAVIDTHGYRFTVVRDRFGPLRSASGLCAQFASPSGIAGPVDARRLAAAVDAKVRKYADVIDTHDVPFVVAVGAHPFTGLELTNVDNLLAGEQVMTFQFNPGDWHIGSCQVDLAHPFRWTMPARLSGLLWMSNKFPFSIGGVRLNAEARRAVPQALMDLRVSEPLGEPQGCW
ncbi:hypothetical protein [Micromonospora sp. C95]|uniref:hypothetical protein n=1 Tax=Micromonospora sp. C95 TaxID=2824882 RepID=UPI001B37DB3E|nr:hypothetical protein [Micromonospora sp. C95]MBQ1022966.1 hypothetical protein [Micromonospora sp. C95]